MRLSTFFTPSLPACLLAIPMMLLGPTFVPTNAHAIPMAGDYTITFGDISGTFTTDGTKLTD